ncbi:MAG: hypothetical protein ACE5G0_07245 [Rhodothermales bacterium]
MSRHIDLGVFRSFLLLILLAGLLGCDSGGTGDSHLAIPTMRSPGNGVTDVPNALELQWYPSAGALTYHVQVSGDAGFATVEVEAQEIDDTSFIINELQVGKTYYWHVRAANLADFSDWSPAWSFTPNAIAVVPPTPVLTFPADDQTSLPTTVMFDWEGSPGATTYHIQVSLDPGFFRKEVDKEGVTGTGLSVSKLIHGYTYYWHVRAVNPAGVSEWSPMRVFVIETG